MPHSKFLTWPEMDQDKAIAFIEHEGKKCNNCGTFPHEWIEPETKMPVFPPPYTVSSLRCLGCVEIAQEQKLVGDGEGKGLYFYLTPWEEASGGP